MRLLPTILVATGPGHRTVTPICLGSSFRRSDSEKPTTANFDVQYITLLPSATSPAPDAVLTICPPPVRSIIRGMNVCIPLITPFRLIPSIQSQNSYVKGDEAATPALLHRIETLPRRASASSAMRA